MRKTLYATFDCVMKEFGVPFVANNDDHALMIHDYSVKKARESGFEQDFELYRLAFFDPYTGVIEGCYVEKVKVDPPKDPQKDLDYNGGND